MPYLMDADWAIHALAGHPRILATLKHLAPEGIAVSWITIGEIYEGAFGSPNAEAHLSSFRVFLTPFPTLNLNDPIMERFAAIRSTLRRRGELIPDFDIIVGATALHYGLTMLTYNVRHLRRIPDLNLFEES